MNVILGVVSLSAGIAGVWGIYIIYRYNSLRARHGKHILGKKISSREIWGRPIRYVVEVEYQLNGNVHLGRIVTTDKRIGKCGDDDQIQLLYVDKIDKIFWAEDDSREGLVYILLLVLFCFFMFVLSGVILVLT